MVSDTVHLVEDLLPLTFDLHTQLAARFVKLADHLRERLLSLFHIHNHHHVEITLDNGLGDIQNVHFVLCQIGSYLGNDTHRFFPYYSNNRFVHICSEYYG